MVLKNCDCIEFSHFNTKGHTARSCEELKDVLQLGSNEYAALLSLSFLFCLIINSLLNKPLLTE